MMTEANLSAAWPHGSATIAVNPAKRKSLARGLALLAVAGIAYYALVVDERGPVMRWAKEVSMQEEAQKYEPTMRKLADSGKPDAMIWMAVNFPATDAGRLDALIRAGSGEAAWVQAGIKAKTDKQESQRLRQVAADNGYLPAVQYAQRPFR
ncbi:hypothetical protein [Paucibacter soli]|uniref:hypothetical protein n=1 Tax=Paucibacter soli TaxID=3133433 RepID=UPI003098CCFB